MLSQRVQVLSESLTMAISSKARQMKNEGIDVLSFSAGEPDFDTLKIVKDEAIKAINSGFSKYTAIPGAPEVLQAIQTKLKRDHGLRYETSQIITNVGAKHSLFNLFQAIIDPKDEVIVPAPYWVTYPEIILYCEGVPVFIDTNEETDFKITPKMLECAITPKTKALILNTPSNPTGSVYSKKELEALGEVLKGTKIIVASDEMYEKLIYGKPFTAVASVSEDLFNRTVTINGLSKCAAMTGWRFGYMASVMDELNSAIKNLQSQSTSNICSIVQKAAIPALLGQANDEMLYMKKAFEKRRDMAVELFSQIKGLSVFKPDGAFYLFINCKEIEPDSMTFCKKMLEEVKVATVPGSGFGCDGYFRFSFATDEVSIQEGIGRIKKFVENYKRA
ncbi:MAG: pyridoxal phosphate-dependent aminotransferase [Sulfurospirillaceae bacterium]|nr:pyridoxal phosphate-dependent aminotransferase [Sulfurospirillaceae bacterium]MCK9546513.1 pyridoxal phosphate-dependent aminotransferase [Sulfurospirillaceae bacterium]NLM99133.1 pyridoxal phosphate-dependent aminotransferase [Campylobacteraceae bacterium]